MVRTEESENTKRHTYFPVFCLLALRVGQTQAENPGVDVRKARRTRSGNAELGYLVPAPSFQEVHAPTERRAATLNRSVVAVGVYTLTKLLSEDDLFLLSLRWSGAGGENIA